MEKFMAGKGSPQPKPTSHTNFSIPFSPKPRHPCREPHTTSHLQPPAAATKDHHLRRLPEDTELSIFDAERYFSEGRRQKKGLVYERAGAPRTPTFSSEASSWPSRLRSLTDSPADPIAAKASLSKHRMGISSASPWTLVRSCPCTRKKAIDVDERSSARRSSKHLDFDGIGSVNLKRKEACCKAAPAGEELEICVSTAAPLGGHDSLAVEEMVKLRLVAERWIHGQDPFLGPSDLRRRERYHVDLPFSDGARTVAVPLTIPCSVNPPYDPARDSLEIFQPAGEASATPRVSAELRQRATPTAFPGEAGPRRNSALPASPVGRVASLEDEQTSDSSSDLFEIESFSTRATPSRPAYPLGSPLDGTATTPRAAKTPVGSSSSWPVAAGPRHPWRADGCAVGEVLRSCQ